LWLFKPQADLTGRASPALRHFLSRLLCISKNQTTALNEASNLCSTLKEQLKFNEWNVYLVCSAIWDPYQKGLVSVELYRAETIAFNRNLGGQLT
jgi:hypothetical protein